MSTPASILSQTLQSITTTKVDELNKQQKSYEKKKTSALEKVDEIDNDQFDRIIKLFKAVKELQPSAFSRRPALNNVAGWVTQASYDPSVPKQMLDNVEHQLRTELDTESRKFDFANLYSQLLSEWLSLSEEGKAPHPTQEDTILDDSFEILHKDRLQQLRDKFEDVVFSPLETDVNEIKTTLGRLFEGEGGEKALERLHISTNTVSAYMKDRVTFNLTKLKKTIKSLLKSNLLNEEKKMLIQDFLQNETVLREMIDVLNMRVADIENWSWDAGEDGISVKPRRQLNGVWRVMMDEDVLQAIFLEHIGNAWSFWLKLTLENALRYTGVWKRGTKIPEEACDRRKFYLQDTNSGLYGNSVENDRRKAYWDDFFLSQLPKHEGDVGGQYEGDDEDLDPDSTRRSWNDMKQELLRRLATEVLLQRSLNGKVAVLQTDLQWYATGMPHSTLFAILEFLKVPNMWLDFFRKFLEAPLNTGPSSSEASSAHAVRNRKRGVPISHAFEKFFGELVLGFMDFAINYHSGQELYRLHDDIWVVGDPGNCAKAWATMQSFAKIMGLEFNMRKTGSVYLTSDQTQKDQKILDMLPKGPVAVDFLTLDQESGTWKINQEAVDAHVTQLRKQLDECQTIFSWIQTWNSCMGRFFTHTFGDPALCFGSAHVDSVLSTHTNMQAKLFTGKGVSSVTEYLKSVISDRFGVSDIPDGFIYMPEEFGGLGLRNPLIPFVLVRGSMSRSPRKIIDDYKHEEMKQYQNLKAAFEATSEREKRRRWKAVYGDEADESKIVRGEAPPSTLGLADPNVFMSAAEYLHYRDATSDKLAKTHIRLRGKPAQKNASLSQEVDDARKRWEQGDLCETQRSETQTLDSEKRWMIALYGEELLEHFGSLSIVDKSLLPLGVMTMLRERKVSWQMVL